MHTLYLDEGAPQSITRLPQWMPSIPTYHLSNQFYTIKPFHTSTFGGIGKQKVSTVQIGLILIRFPLPANSYFDFQSLLVYNNIPMLLGFQTQINLHTITDKQPVNPTIKFNKIGIELPLTKFDCHIYCIGPSCGEIIFSMRELAQIHRNLGHAPVGSVYSSLRRAYPIETDVTDVDKLQAITTYVRVANFIQNNQTGIDRSFPITVY